MMHFISICVGYLFIFQCACLLSFAQKAPLPAQREPSLAQLTCEVRELKKLLIGSTLSVRQTLTLIDDLRSKRDDAIRIRAEIDLNRTTVEMSERAAVQLTERMAGLETQLTSSNGIEKDSLSADVFELRKSITEQASMIDQSKGKIDALRSELTLRELEISKIQNSLIDLNSNYVDSPSGKQPDPEPCSQNGR